MENTRIRNLLDTIKYYKECDITHLIKLNEKNTLKISYLEKSMEFKMEIENENYIKHYKSVESTYNQVTYLINQKNSFI